MRKVQASFGRKLMGLAVLMLIALWISPSLAQFSDTWEFLKAVKERDYREMRSRLFKGANINARNADGEPPIVIAAESGDMTLARFVLEQGAIVDVATEKRGETALMVAAEGGHDTLLRILIESGADVDRADRGGETALMKAARARKKMIAEILIEAGADPTIEDYTGQTALQLAKNARARGVEKVLRDAGVLY